MRCWRIVLWCVCCLPGLAVGQTPVARAWADSSTFVVGDPVRVHVEITHSGGTDFTPLVGDTLGVFHVLSRPAPRKTSDAALAATFTVSAYDSGTAILPPIPFSYRRPGDSTVQTTSTNPLLFTVRLVEVDTSQDIKDLKPTLSIPLTVAEISLILGVATGIALVAFAVYRYRKKKRDRKPEEAYVPPPKLAHVIALEELALLKEKRLWQQGLIKPYYSEVTEIIRRYFENRFSFMALEKTTDETMEDLRHFRAATPILEETDRILRRADLVKFAKYQPSIPEHEEMLALAFDIVDRTRVIETPAQPAAAREAAHV